MDLININQVEENSQNFLNDIIESIKLDESEKINIPLQNINEDKEPINYKEEINLFSNNIDRKIGNYLFNEIENKSSYIQELEEIIKFQEKEISELKTKLDSINKLELLSKLKSTITSKVESNNDENIVINNNENEKHIKKIQVVQVNKAHDNETNDFNNINQDLVLSCNLKPKPKFSDINEPSRYNGISILEKPPQQEKKIIIEKSDDTDNLSDILKLRRRGRKL